MMMLLIVEEYKRGMMNVTKCIQTMIQSLIKVRAILYVIENSGNNTLFQELYGILSELVGENYREAIASGDRQEETSNTVD